MPSVIEHPCSRCNGSGIMPFPHVRGGECFRCWGTKVLPERPRLGRLSRWVVLEGYRNKCPVFEAPWLRAPGGRKVYAVRLYDEPQPFFVPFAHDRVNRRVVLAKVDYPEWALLVLQKIKAAIFH